MEKCKACPCPLDVPCANDQPWVCQWAAGGDPIKRRHILGVSRHRAGMPAPSPTPTPCADAGSPRPLNLRREVVVARYHEDLAWLDAARNVDFVSLYDKGGGGGHGLSRPHAYTFLPNKGREAGTLLEHLCRHYHSLADTTIFLQGDGLSHERELLSRVAYEFDRPTPLSRQYQLLFPAKEIKDADRVEQSGPYAIHYGNALCSQGKNVNGDRWFNPAAWQAVFATPQPDPLWFGYSAQWSLPRASITHRPLGFWRWLLSEVMKPATTIDVWDNAHPLTAWALEALWNYLWDPAFPTTDTWKTPPAVTHKCGTCGSKQAHRMAEELRLGARKRRQETG